MLNFPSLLDLRCHILRWPLRRPFRIHGADMYDVPVLQIRLQDAQGRCGHAEAAGVDYHGETPESMAQQIHDIAAALHADIDHHALQNLLPAGGARNALDCALHDLRAKQTGITVATRCAVAPMRALRTLFTLGLGDAAETRAAAKAARNMPQLKLKVGAVDPLMPVQIVREICPDTALLIDCNGAWTRAELERLLPALCAAQVQLIEQPLPAGQDAALDGLHSPIPLAADESCQDRSSLPQLIGRYQFINLKLDKTGGLTEALALADAARQHGLRCMVGNMCGSSLAMAPAFVLGQRCEWVDLDGPQLQASDVEHAMRCENGWLMPPTPALWG